MIEEPLSDRTFEQYLAGELRVLNAHLARRRKRLSDLLAEERPFVDLHDDTAHLFDKEELARLASLLDETDRQALLLPMMIEVGGGEGEAALLCTGGVEEKAVSRVLGMDLACRGGRLLLYRRQLSALRLALKTATQYVYSLGE